MPVIKSAIKKWRKDKKRTELNNQFRTKLKFAVRAAKKSHAPEVLQDAFSVLDKAAKRHLIHANKAARIKAVLSRSAMPTLQSTTDTKPAKTPVKNKKRISRKTGI